LSRTGGIIERWNPQEYRSLEGFNELVKKYDNLHRTCSDSDNVRRVMRCNWIFFLENGCDIAKIVKMMDPMDVWINYYELIDSGAKIDIHELVLKLYNNSTDSVSAKRFIRRRFEEIIRRGGDPNIVAQYFHIEHPNHITKLLDFGVSAETVFELSQDLLEQKEGSSGEIRKIFLVFHGHGLPSDSIVKWVCGHSNETLVSDIAQGHPELWNSMGVDIDTYINAWIKECGRRHLLSTTGLPKITPPDKFLSGISMEQLFRNVDPEYDFDSFLEDFQNAGGDIHLLAEKFIKEIGYPSDICYLFAMESLWRRGARINNKKLIEVLYEALHDCDEEITTLDELINWPDECEEEDFGLE